MSASFVGNLAVLFLPFMALRRGLTTEPYSLTSSIRMMWHAELYVLAALIVGFSVLFPFAKLAVLAAVCAAAQPGPHLRWMMEGVERLAKWSMLDVFIVCIILGLTSGQLLVAAQPAMGIPVFVGAISLSMLAGAQLSAGLRTAPLPAPRIRGGWLTVTGLTLLGTLATPFLVIREWLLADHSYSIVTLAVALLRNGAWIAGLVIALFLIVAPVLVWGATFRLWLRQRRGGPAEAVVTALHRWRHWSMLDVFGIALGVFLIEGDSLIHTEVRFGALFLALLLIARRGVESLAIRSSRRPRSNQK